MEALGLQPSSTGMVGGKRTGASVARTMARRSHSHTRSPRSLPRAGKWICRARLPWRDQGTVQQDHVHLSPLRLELLGPARPLCPLCGPCILQAAPPVLAILRAYIVPAHSDANTPAMAADRTIQ